MLYSDSKRRIAEIRRLSDLFKRNGYTRTATGISSFTNILKGDSIPSDFLKRLNLVFRVFHIEFEKKIPVGQKYRKDVFEEIADTTLKAIKRLGKDYPHALLTIFPLFQALNRGTKITSQIGNFINSKMYARPDKCGDKNVEFHLYCYTYLIIVEGLFDELARILYFLNVASPGNLPSLNSLKSLTVYTIRRRLGSSFVFLKKWDDKKHIRNAIGHATAFYDPEKDEVQFIDRSWNSGVIPLKEFIRMALELEDSIWAFFYDFLLLRIYDFIASKKPFQ